MKRNIYLNKLSLEEAKSRIEQAILNGKVDLRETVEQISTEDSLNRITAEPVYARRSSLHYTAAAMDGIAVHSLKTQSASENHPVILTRGIDFVYLNTGNALPCIYDAVIKIEDIVPILEGESIKNENLEEKPDQIRIFQSVYPGSNIRQIGEDIITHQLILPVNHSIRPVDIGALLAGGLTQITVRQKPKIGIIPTGEEIVEPGDHELKEGDILDFNSRMLSSSVIQWGGIPQVYPVVRDIQEELTRTLLSAILENDILVIIAGTSAGSQDYTATSVQEVGEVLFHGVAIMPGKPTIAGIVQKVPVIGLPGYPVSFMIAAWEFVLPLVCKKLGMEEPEREKLEVTMGKKVVSKLGSEEFLRVKLARIDQKIIAHPLNRGAGVISSLLEADALVRIPSLSEGLSFKEKVVAELLEHQADLDRTIVNIGSHDLLLDVIKNELQKRSPRIRFASFHVGSMGGLMALKQGVTHMATSHLLDIESGEYNFPYIQRIIPEVKLVIVQLAYRQQGLMVLKGNPKRIQGIHDLNRPDIRYINRQKGSGTRVLLDYLLSKNHIRAEEIQGYQQEEFSHLMVASAVATGKSDVGMGIYSASKAFGLDFIPIIEEQYDLIIPERYISLPSVQKVLEVIQSNDFKEQAGRLGGYNLNRCGQVLLK